MVSGLPACIRHRALRFSAPMRHRFRILRVVGRVETAVPFTTL